MNPDDWLSRSARSLESARILLEADPDAACSRAYYAMFYASRAALLMVGKPELAMAKTHAGMISAFGEHLVKSGKLEVELGRTFSQVERERLLADYTGDGVTVEAATEALKRAVRFVNAINELLDSSR